MASREQMHSLFTYIGPVAEIVVYNANKPDPLNPNAAPPTKICFVTFENPSDADLALHLHQTVFMDRPVTVAITGVTAIPSEEDAQKVAHLISALTPSAGQPQLSAPADPTELQRTVYVENVPPTTTAEEFLQYLNTVGEVKYLRFAGSLKSRTALVEFSTVQGAQQAMLKSGTTYKDKQLTVAHSATAISKPEGYVNAETQSDVMYKLKEVEHLIGNFAARVTGVAPAPARQAASAGTPRAGTHEPASVSGAADAGSSRRRDSRSRDADEERRRGHKSASRRRSRTNSPSYTSKRDGRDSDRGSRRDGSHRSRDQERDRRYERSRRDHHYDADDYVYVDDRRNDRRDRRARDYDRVDDRYVDDSSSHSRRHDDRRRRDDDVDQYADDHKHDRRGRNGDREHRHRSDRPHRRHHDEDDGGEADEYRTRDSYRSSKRKTVDDDLSERGNRDGEKSKRSKHSRRIKEEDEDDNEPHEKTSRKRDKSRSRSINEKKDRRRRDRRKADADDEVDDVSMDDADDAEEQRSVGKPGKTRGMSLIVEAGRRPSK